MKIIILFILFFVPDIYAAPKIAWIVAPQVFGANEESRLSAEKKMNADLQRYHPGKLEVQIVPDIKDGYAVSYFLQLRKNPPKVWPDYILYYEPAKFLANDLEELLLTDLNEAQDFHNIDKDIEKRQSLTPLFLESILGESSRIAFKKLLFYRSRLAQVGPWFHETNSEKLILDLSTWPVQRMRRVVSMMSNGKTKVVMLLSTERINYRETILHNGSWAGALAQMFWIDVNISGRKLKGMVPDIPLDIFLLPGRFYDLNQNIYLRADSKVRLNSLGVQRWVDLMGSTLADPRSPTNM